MNAIRFCVVLMVSFFVAGCGTTGRHVQWYAGAPMGTNNVARLKIQRDFGGINLMVDDIDGLPLNHGKWYVGNNTREIELLPGRHYLMVSYDDSNGGRSMGDARIGFPAEAGKTYQMRGAPEEKSYGTEMRLAFLGGQFVWTLWILDVETGKVVAGEPRLAPFHWYEN